MDKAFCRTLAAAQTPEQFRACIAEKETAAQPAPKRPTGRHIRLLAVTACPNGLAHTYMAAEALESAAKAKGWEVKVETQGSIGLENELTAEDVASADMVILTKDIGIKFEERFAGKTIVRVNISDAVKRADAIMSKIEAHLAQTA